MTEQEFLDKYSEIKVKFNYYYKYSFSFKGVFEDKTIYVNVGGSSDDIYKFEVDSDKEYLIKELDVSSIEVSKDGKIIEEGYFNW